MSFAKCNFPFGNRKILAKENDPKEKVHPLIVVPRSLFPKRSEQFGRFHKTTVANLFKKRKLLGSSQSKVDFLTLETSLKRERKKTSRLEAKVKTLQANEHKLNSKISDQNQIISKLTNAVSKQSKEIAKFNKTITSQSNQIEEMNAKRDATRTILEWYNQTNDDLCKRLIETNTELLELRNSMDH